MSSPARSALRGPRSPGACRPRAARRGPLAIRRRAILFGGDGVLINNIAWLLRRLPVFAVGGTGGYRIRPVHVDDLARLCLAAGSATETYTLDAVGPERPAFYDLVCFI